MRKALLLGLALLFVASAASAQLGYIGLYVDDTRSEWCARGQAAFYPVTMWIWCLPGVNGQICAEFMVAYPANVIQSTIADHPDISVTLAQLGQIRLTIR